MLNQHQSENFVNSSRTRLRLLLKRDFLPVNPITTPKRDSFLWTRWLLLSDRIFLLRTRFLHEPVTRWRRVWYVASIFISVSYCIIVNIFCCTESGLQFVLGWYISPRNKLQVGTYLFTRYVSICMHNCTFILPYQLSYR